MASYLLNKQSYPVCSWRQVTNFQPKYVNKSDLQHTSSSTISLSPHPHCKPEIRNDGWTKSYPKGDEKCNNKEGIWSSNDFKKRSLTHPELLALLAFGGLFLPMFI